MIIISTHNGKQYLENLLQDLKNFNIKNKEIVIIDNRSNDSENLVYLKELSKQRYKVITNIYNSFEIGAFKYAIDYCGIKDDYYFFLQDSIRIKQDIFSLVTPKLDDNNIYTFLTFLRGIFDSPNDNLFLQLNFGSNEYSTGIFGNMFFANHNVVQRIKDDLIIPKNKLDSMGMERGLARIFDNHNIKINGLDMYDPTKSGHPDGYDFFQKIYGARG